MTLITNLADLIVERWYCIGVANLDGKVDWNGAPLRRYEGGGQWTDDEGSPVETAWDPDLQMSISINNADAYMLQS